MRPRKAEEYKAKRDTVVKVHLTYKNPSSGGGEAVLPAGEVVVVSSDPPAGARGIWALPVEYERLEETLVPSEERGHPMYQDYCLVITFDQLVRDFELVSSGRRGAPAVNPTD